MKLAIFIVLALFIGFIIGYFVSYKTQVIKSSGFLHVIRDPDDPKPMIFLELRSSEGIRESGKFITLTVLHAIDQEDSQK